MQKRRSIMVSENTYKEIKKIKAHLLVKKDLEIKNLGQVVEYMILYYKEKEGKTL